jgi:hypothetical protein
MHAERLGFLADAHPFSDDGQGGVITLSELAQLPEPRTSFHAVAPSAGTVSEIDQPKRKWRASSNAAAIAAFRFEVDNMRCDR